MAALKSQTKPKNGKMDITFLSIVFLPVMLIPLNIMTVATALFPVRHYSL